MAERNNNPKGYIPFTQQKYCCTAASMQSVIERRGLKLPEQEYLAAKLGLIVPKEYSELLPLARTGSKPGAGWGTQISQPEYEPNKVFQELGLPLTFETLRVRDVEHLRTILQDAQDSEDDALVCYGYSALWGEGSDGGHVSVFCSLEGSQVTMIDPERNVPKYRTVTLEDLYRAIAAHDDHSAGVWMIRGMTQ